ncbi:uncharacterized protein LOC144142759 isoform X2 [Haemaphysalis longicornis]
MAFNPSSGSQAGPSSRPLKRRSNEGAPPPVAPKRRRSGPAPPSNRVNVAVRVRPLNEREVDSASVVRVVDEACLVFDPAEEAEPFYFQGQRACGGLVRPNKNQTFMFDKVFDESKDNMYIYEHTTKDMLKTLLDGCNCSVLAYGATGAGKTFTMLGSEECPGVVSLTVSELYRRVDELQSEGQKCDVAVAYFEVYNEVVRDLLCPGGSPLVVRDDPSKGIVISNLSTHRVKEADALLELLLRGNRNRTQHATDANAESSRSHAIFQVYVSQTENVTGTSKNIRASKMSFVDLAGSERAAAVSRNNGARLREGTKINLSLLALGNCIDALSKNGAQRVQYRNSKLTHILKDSLGGTCQTLMIAAVSPSKLSFSETHNTLKYAERAMKIQLQAKKNILSVNVHMSMYSGLINDMKQKLECVQRKLEVSEGEKKVAQGKCATYEARVSELEAKLRESDARYEALVRACSAGGATAGVGKVSAGEFEVGPLSVTPQLCLDVTGDSPTAAALAQAAEFYIKAAHKIYNKRAQIIEQIWDQETIVRTTLIKENWRQQIATTLRILQGTSEEAAAKDCEKLDNFLQSQAAKRLAAKERLEVLDNERRTNFECCQELFDKASADGCLQLVEAELPSLERDVQLAEVSGRERMFACLAELLGQKCEHWEALNGSALPHLRNLYDILDYRNCCSSDQRDAHAAVVKKAKGPGVTWADEQQPKDSSSLSLGSLLSAPDWRFRATVRRKSAAPLAIASTVGSDDPFEQGFSGEATFVRFPHGSPHPMRARAPTAATNSRAVPQTPVAPSWGPACGTRSSPYRTPPSPSVCTPLGGGYAAVNETFVAETPRQRAVFQPVSPRLDVAGTRTAGPSVRKFMSYRPSSVFKENTGMRTNHVPSASRSNPRPVRNPLRKSLSTSSIGPRPSAMGQNTFRAPTGRPGIATKNRLLK